MGKDRVATSGFSIFIAALICLLTVACGGGGGAGGAEPIASVPGQNPPAVGATAPSQPELEGMLAAELDRLGIDPERTTALAPRGKDNAVFDLVATQQLVEGPEGDRVVVELSFTEILVGDYNQDQVVNSSDLTAIGQYWGRRVTYDDPGLHDGIEYWPAGDPDGDGAANWRLARVDGNHNGLIEMGDITVIAQHWVEFCRGYHVYRSGPDDEVVTLRGDRYYNGNLTVQHPSSPAADAPVRFTVTDELEEGGTFVYYAVPFDTQTWEAGPQGNRVSVEIDLNRRPVAELTVSAEEGKLPLEVELDASGSTDPDGEIVLYELSLTGDDGYFVIDPPQYTHTFITKGLQQVLLRVTDDEGAQTTTEVWVDVHDGDYPDAVLTADPSSLLSGLEVAFDAAGSSSPNGAIVLYEYDYDGDGEYDLSGAAAVTASHTYGLPGVYSAVLRVTDEGGLTGTDTVEIEVLNRPPVAAITASKVSGMPPLRSNLDASGSSDPDGEIVSYEFDWEGDGTWDVHSGSPVQWHDFPRGTFQTAVRVTDDLGARDTASIEINTDLPPEADLWCLYTTGEAPLAVTFDMSRSKGGAGYLVSYEYDWESDGTIDLVTEKNNYIHRVFETPGTYEVSATVINDTGLTDTTSTTITVYPGNGAPNWHYLTVCGGYYPETELIDGKPAMAYLDVDDGVHCAKYITALDGRGFSWAEPVVIGESVSTYPWHEIKVELISVGGLPTACFPQANESTGHIELVFSQAMDVTGQSWSPPVVVAAEADDDLFAYALAEINGRPAVAYCFYDDIGLYYRTATGADGTEWELPVMANQQNQSRAEELSLALVDGRPAIAWVDPALLYAIAADPLGETWPHVYQYSTWNPYLHVDMCVVDGHPAIAFYECGNIVGPGKDLWYRRAEDPAGGSWAAPVRLTDSSDELDSGRYLSMAVVAGKPAVTCWESLPGDVISFVAATDGVGTAWDPPELISQWYDYGERSSLMETAEGYPGIAMDQYGICWAVKF